MLNKKCIPCELLGIDCSGTDDDTKFFEEECPLRCKEETVGNSGMTSEEIMKEANFECFDNKNFKGE